MHHAVLRAFVVSNALARSQGTAVSRDLLHYYLSFKEKDIKYCLGGHTHGVYWLCCNINSNK